MSRLMTKATKWLVCPAKTQISLGIRPVWSDSSLCAQWVAKDPSFLHAVSEDSDQTRRMPRLIWIFAGRTCHFVGFVQRRLILSLRHFSYMCLVNTLLLLYIATYYSIATYYNIATYYICNFSLNLHWQNWPSMILNCNVFKYIVVIAS